MKTSGEWYTNNGGQQEMNSDLQRACLTTHTMAHLDLPSLQNQLAAIVFVRITIIIIIVIYIVVIYFWFSFQVNMLMRLQEAAGTYNNSNNSSNNNPLESNEEENLDSHNSIQDFSSSSGVESRL